MFAIKNEHVIGVQDLFEENGTAYYVMDYVDGENLAERLKRTGKPMTEQEVCAILPQILDALKSVHDAGIWHLDLKPANILIDKSGIVKLIDFGASKQLNAQKGGATTSTAISYTNGYAPREQMEQNYDKFGPWTDIYALGATLYNLLTNKRPPLPSDIDDDETEDKHAALPFAQGVSDEMKNLVLQFMNTNRKRRPQGISDVFRMLDEKQAKVKNTIVKSVEVNTEVIEDEETIIATDPKYAPQITSDLGTEEVDEYGIDDEPELTIDSLIKEYWLTALFCLLASFLFWYIGCGNPDNFVGGDRSNHPANLLGSLYNMRFFVPLLFLILLSISFVVRKYFKISENIVNLVLVGGFLLYFFILMSSH